MSIVVLPVVARAVAVLRPLNPAVAYLTLLSLMQRGTLDENQARLVLEETGLAAAGYELPEPRTIGSQPHLENS